MTEKELEIINGLAKEIHESKELKRLCSLVLSGIESRKDTSSDISINRAIVSIICDINLPEMLYKQTVYFQESKAEIEKNFIAFITSVLKDTNSKLTVLQKDFDSI